MIKMSKSNKERLLILGAVIIYILLAVVFRSFYYNSLLDDYKLYGQSLKIHNDPKKFDYAIKTKVGGVLAEGKLSAETPISFEGKKYIFLEKTTERYTMHTRTVTTTVNGKTTSRTEVYYTWDEIDRETKQSKKVSFLNKKFNTDYMAGMYEKHICTRSGGYRIRYQYNGYEDNQNVTMTSSTTTGKVKGIDGGYPMVYENSISDVIASKNPDSRLLLATGVFTVIYLVIALAIIGVILDSRRF